ncbi:MAG TPA: 16S rRNA (guanine(527)-N(7))-methyltransferase RsmG [Candidatus Sulfotelmatobacter sp.]|nr:16S rRNA (guanine(527)-N(7))-methyltransferase RsmG [Candidatus Sulfotelmatobacter sp.]
MTNQRIAELVAPFLGGHALSSEQLTTLSRYLDLLLQWNAKINLTAVRDPEEIATRHFGESLFAARHLLSNPGPQNPVVDVGAGAGFPGLPMKIWAPTVELTLIESNHKKAVFLRDAVRTLGLQGVTVVPQRAEKVQLKAGLVVMRAVERFEDSLPIARTLLGPGRRLALLIGAAQVEMAKSLVRDLRWEHALSVPLSRNRVLLTGVSEA